VFKPLPKSEYRKRRDYWLAVKQATTGVRESASGVSVEETGFKIESDATIIE
jgi:hypothetical protein